MNPIDWFESLPASGKWMIGIGAAAIVLFVWKPWAKSSGTSVTGVTTPDPNAGIVNGDLYGGGANVGTGNNGNQVGVDSGLGSNSGIPGNQSVGINPTTTTLTTTAPLTTATTTTSTPPATSSSSGVATPFVTKVTTNSTNKDRTYSPVFVSSSGNSNNDQQTAVNLANQNPGSPVNVVNSNGNRTAYAVSKAAANGTTDYTSNNYNSAVNAAGGQWLSLPGQNQGTFFAGSYDTNGSFETNNKSQQSSYNNVVKNNPKPNNTVSAAGMTEQQFNAAIAAGKTVSFG